MPREAKKKTTEGKKPAADVKKTATLNPDNPNYEISKKLLEMAESEKQAGGNVFGSNAIRKAAFSINDYPTKLKNGKEATQIQGIGKGVADRIDRILNENNDDSENINDGNLKTPKSKDGTNKLLEGKDMNKEDGKEKKKKSSKEDARSIAEKKFADDFKMKIEREEVDAIEKYLRKEIKQIDEKYDIQMCGSYRRGTKSSDIIELLLTHQDVRTLIKSKGDLKTDTTSEFNYLKKFIDHFSKSGFLEDMVAKDKFRYEGACQLSSSRPFRKIVIVFLAQDQYVLGLIDLTGSESFNQHLNKVIADQGYIKDEYYLRKVGSTGVPGAPIELSSEEEAFEYLNLSYKKPQERNNL